MTAEERMMWVERYSALPTGNVADAMDGLGLKRGSVLGLHPIDPSQKRAAGFARTILQKRRSTPWDGVNLAKHGKVIDDKTEPGDLLVISMGGIMDVSTGGDLLALRAQLRGVQGELTDGCLRDTDDIAAFGFPAYSAGTAPNKSAYDIETVGVDVPVTLCGVLIFPGDMVVMDRTGVVVVPSGKIVEVYESASRIAKREERVAVHLREGKTLTESRKLAAAEVGQ
ncbi:RraA family protein [Clostridium sp.]